MIDVFLAPACVRARVHTQRQTLTAPMRVSSAFAARAQLSHDLN
jgi:hypothetical protein